MECEWIGWCSLTISEQAAWVQAIGSLLAIGIAIYVPWRQRSHTIADEKRRDQERAKLAATALYPAIDQFRASLINLLKFSELSHEARRSMPSTGILRPLEFDQFRTDLHLLGELGHRVNRLIGKFDIARNAAMAVRNMKVVPAATIDKMKAEFPKLIEEAIQCAKALEDRGTGKVES